MARIWPSASRREPNRPPPLDCAREANGTGVWVAVAVRLSSAPKRVLATYPLLHCGLAATVVDFVECPQNRGCGDHPGPRVDPPTDAHCQQCSTRVVKNHMSTVVETRQQAFDCVHSHLTRGRPPRSFAATMYRAASQLWSFAFTGSSFRPPALPGFTAHT